ncbi:hypothetical protein AOB54_08520 [beta proteobacterium MWH-UniP1]
MFRLIGVVVVVAVLYLGFGAIQKWYSGDATPQETVTEVRKRVGETLVGEKDAAKDPGASPGQAAPAPQSAPAQQKPLDTDDILRQLMRK